MDAVPGISFVDHARLLGILQSDSFLSNNQQIDAMRLKEELQAVKHRKGSGAVGSSGGGQGGRACARCRAELGRIINRGAICRVCRCRVCKSCRQYCQRQPTDWLCTVCHKHMELATATGDWMNDFSHLPEKRSVQMNAAERIKHSIQRSWTFSVDASSMPSPWAALRNSPEMRAYSSMPRHHDYGGRPTYLPPPPSAASDSPPPAASDLPPPAAPPSSPAPRTSEDERQTTAVSDSTSSAVSDLPPPAAPPSSPAPRTSEDERKTNGRQQTEATDRQHTVNAGSLVDKVVRGPSSDQESGGDLSSVGSSPMIEKRSSAALSSPVIRKVALRRRRVDAANLPPGVTPPRSRRHLIKGAGGGEASTDEESSWLVESGTDDYRLVFISSSDSSSREDLPSDDDDCAWDYYLETGPNSGACAIITPRADLEGGLNSVITPRADLEAGPNAGACAVIAPRATETLGAASRRPTVAARGDISVIPIPVPVPVPVPVLVPVPWHPEFTIRVQHCLAPVWRELLLRHGGGSGAMTPQGADMPAGDDSQQNNTASDDVVLKLYKPLEEKSVDPVLPPEPSSTDNSSSDEEQTATKRVYRFNDQTVVDGVSASSSSDYSDSSASTSSEQSTRPTKRTRRTYVVNHSNNVECDIPGLERNYEEDDTDCASDTGVTLIKHTSVSSDTGVTLIKHTSVSSDTLEKLTSVSSDTGVTLIKHTGVDEMCNKEDVVGVDSGYRPRNVHLSDIFDSVKNDVIVKRDVVGESGSTVSVNVNDVASVNVNEVAKRNEVDSVSSARDLEPVSACQEPQSAAFECDSLSRDAVLSQPVPRQPEVSSADSLGADNNMIDSLDPPRHYHNDERSLDVQDSLDVVEKCEAVNENVRRCDSDINENVRRCDSDSNENARRCDSDNEGGANVGTRSSSASDEFSGTESMELNGTDKLERIVNDNQRPETGRYTSLVMITQDRPATIVQDCESLVNDEVDTSEQVRVVLGGDTLSCLEEGLADDDSWVEELDREESVAATTTEDSSEGEDAGFADREEELRGYNRTAIDFTLHTIVEESCEESEAESEKRPTRPLERYFFYGLGDGDDPPNDADTISETSSVHSETLDSESVEPEGEDGVEDAVETACSRLEKYFLSGFMGFSRRDSDGSVGSDSEGRPSPEQRRKRLVRARGAGRSHSSSLDNLLAEAEQLPAESQVVSGEGSSDEEEESLFEKNDGQFDTVKRTKKKKRSVSSAPEVHLLEVPDGEVNEDGREEEADKNGEVAVAELASSRGKQHSRDSGFMGSCDDLLKEPPTVVTSLVEEKDVVDKGEDDDKPSTSTSSTASAPPVREREAPPNIPAESLVRKDSFNNWSSDEETNLMMSKMRAFFKTMVGNQPKAPPASPGPQPRTRSKPPQLVYFESELTRLMKTVPGLRDDQVREIVEYLSSEDTWSDSYDSSDYTSSDLEGAGRKSVLQQQISASCRQIIDNFTPTSVNSRPIIDTFTPTPTPEARPDEAAVVYQRLVASLGRLDANDSQHTSSPPLIAKVMQHIGSRLVALMHEVSSGEGGGGGSGGGGQSSPRVGAARMHHRRSTTVKPGAASTTEEDEDEEDEGRRGGGGSSPPLALPLPRSKSHDPLLEASDNERFSWRGSFESALLAASDSRTRLLETTSSVQPSGKRRSASDLLAKGGSRDRLDRVRSCGSIGGSLEDKIWGAGRRSPLDSGGSADGEDDSDDDRRLQRPAAANSLPRLPTAPGTATSLYKAHSLHQFAAASGGGVKSARYRPPGYPAAASRGAASSVVAPPPRRLHDRRSRSQVGSPPPANVLASSDDGSICSEPVSGVGRAGQDEDAVDRLINQHRASLGARSDSLASVYSGAGEGRYGSVAVRGEVEFGLQYNYKQAALEIHIKQCRDLAPVDTKRNRSDPYVKVYLLPDKSKSGKRKTRVKKHTLNPVFEETLKFHITLEGLETRTLWLSVWHSDMFGRNDFLGEVTMSLENKVFDDPLPRFYTLQERSEPLDELLSSKGELIVGLKYVPPEASTGGNGKKSAAAKGALHVLVKEAKNLTAVKSNGLSDPFCKSYLLPDKMRSSKQKTAVLRRTCQPTWAHTFVYPHVTLDELAERSLELTVWDHDRLASNEFLGGVRLNLGSGKHNGKAVDWMDSNGKEILLWQWMMERPNLWVESCLPLRPSLDVRHNS
ncbi:uncharacterized protein LOC111055235 isoform X2 [Nilaparvata lugens]|uniref:uncharacterized protein LOC111055235 isoform X2 n=1 Tax=Nilaparvata lugens TaxID=108931 RepID=UPI00193D1D46|nr:uncharacterized protein LOC111055235 isoform X2 [Nilaparvata lugens]